MRLTKACAIAVAAAGITALSHAQLMGFFFTGQNTKIVKSGKIMNKQDLSWTVVNEDKTNGFTNLGWVVDPYFNVDNKVTFVTPPKNCHWISGYGPVGGGGPYPDAVYAIYTYTTKFTVGKNGAQGFNGEYASFENVTSLKLNGNAPKSGGSNTFQSILVGKSGNSFNSWTKFNFGNLAQGQYTLVATVDDTNGSGINEMIDGKVVSFNPAAFALTATADQVVAQPEPASLIALPIGLLLLRRSARKKKKSTGYKEYESD